MISEALNHKFIMSENPEKGTKSRVQGPDLDGKEIYSKMMSSSSSKMQFSMSKSPRWKESSAKYIFLIKTANWWKILWFA